MKTFKSLYKFFIYVPVIITSSSIAIRALFPILGAFFFSQQDYVNAVTLIGILSIVGMISGLEFHSVIIREFSKNVNSFRFRKQAILKNLSTSLPRGLIGGFFLWLLLAPLVKDNLDYPFVILILPLIIFLDLILSEASRLHNTSGEFIAGSILTNFKNVGWLFILPFILFLGFNILDSLIISYGLSLIVLSIIFSKDFKFKDLISFPKSYVKNLKRFTSILKDSLFLLVVGWIGLLNPMAERYMLALSDNFEFSANFFFLGSLAAISHVLTTNIALIPFHKILLRPSNLKKTEVSNLLNRLLITIFIVIFSIIFLFWLIPQEYYPSDIIKAWEIFVPLVISSQLLVIGSFFSLRLYAAKSDKKLLVISVTEFSSRIFLVFLMIETQNLEFIAIGMMCLSALICFLRIYVYRTLNIV